MSAPNFLLFLTDDHTSWTLPAARPMCEPRRSSTSARNLDAEDFPVLYL